MSDNEARTGETVDALLRRGVKDYPDRWALRSDEKAWTYTELDQWVARLAGALRERGVGKGSRVGLLVPRSAACVALILAVLRRGAAYVPLDPGHPAKRLAYVRQHSGVHLLVTAEGHTAPPGPGTDIDLAELLVEAERPLAGASLTTDASISATPDDTAHILYTSGSTGTPKGVRLSQRAVANNVQACVRTFGLRPDDVLVLKTPLTFDVSAYEMFSALAAGACLIIAPTGAEGDPDLLAATVDTHGVTVLHTVPAQLRALTETDLFIRNSSLRAVMSTGEKLPVALQRAFHSVRREPLYNFYGPTETAYATAYRAMPEEADAWAGHATVPIGRPLDNVRCYVLDESGRPVPDGQVGELHIGGLSLADGYLDDPDRTAERFFHIDIGGGRTDRVYRTGDLVRRLPSGDLLYLGRDDDQVKIAGQRIELGEVESAIRDVTGVRDVAIAVRERDPDGAPELIAFVEFDPTSRHTAGSLRAELAAWLPARMIPAHLVPVARIPLLPNGKTDRLALARLHPVPAQRSGDTVAAAPGEDTPMAELVRRCFAEALGGPPPANDSHFLHEGGDSLLAMRVVARMRRAGVQISVAEFLSHPVMADLIAYVSRLPAQTAPPSTIGGGTRPDAAAPAGVVPAHAWFTERVRTDRTYWNMFVRLRVVRPVAPANLEAALRAVVAAHPALRARFANDGTGLRMLPAGEAVADDLVRTLDVAGPAEREAAIDQLHRSLAPFTGDHLRALLVHDREDDATYLVIAVHHLVVDIVSWHVLLDDLVFALDALERAEEPVLPALAETFQGWADTLPTLGTDAQETAYWLSILRLRKAAPGLTARGPAHPERAGQRLTLRFSAATTRQLLGPAPVRLGMCVHDVMAAAVGLALARWRPGEAVTFDLETHGRHRWPRLDRVVGWFTAIFPVAWRTAPANDLAAELEPARAALAAVPSGGTGYGIARYRGTDPRRAEALQAPPALVCFNYLGRGDLDPPGDRFRTDGTPMPWEARSPQAERLYPVEISAFVVDDQLAVWLSWAPSPADGLDESSMRRLCTHLTATFDELARADAAEAVSGVSRSSARPQPGPHR